MGEGYDNSIVCLWYLYTFTTYSKNTSSKLPWVVLPGDVPTSDEYYDAREVWSDDSRARLKAAFKAD